MAPFREAHTDSLAIDQVSGKKPVSANQLDSYAELEEKNSRLLAGRAFTVKEGIVKLLDQ